jgi:hypothetical protein
MVFFQNPPVEGTVNSMEQKTRVFCFVVQEFIIRVRIVFMYLRTIVQIIFIVRAVQCAMALLMHVAFISVAVFERSC